MPVVVNMLSDALAPLAWQFAKPQEDKCAGVSLSDTIVAAPRLRDCLAHFVCRTDASHDGDDHIVVIGKILDFDHDDGDAPVFFRGQMHRPAPVSPGFPFWTKPRMAGTRFFAAPIAPELSTRMSSAWPASRQDGCRGC